MIGAEECGERGMEQHWIERWLPEGGRSPIDAACLGLSSILNRWEIISCNPCKLGVYGFINLLPVLYTIYWKGIPPSEIWPRVSQQAVRFKNANTKHSAEHLNAGVLIFGRAGVHENVKCTRLSRLIIKGVKIFASPLTGVKQNQSEGGDPTWETHRSSALAGWMDMMCGESCSVWRQRRSFIKHKTRGNKSKSHSIHQKVVTLARPLCVRNKLE